MSLENEEGRGGEAISNTPIGGPRRAMPASVASAIEEIRSLTNGALDGLLALDPLKSELAGPDMVASSNMLEETLSQILEVLDAWTQTYPLKPWTKAQVRLVSSANR